MVDGGRSSRSRSTCWPPVKGVPARSVRVRRRPWRPCPALIAAVPCRRECPGRAGMRNCGLLGLGKLRHRRWCACNRRDGHYRS
ncbi:hypothetical protein GLA29479_2928 [Lysobacter antibioticus]|nr:hypothetical protein GLA29479_2928 [Lysobacter antibioticus]